MKIGIIGAGISGLSAALSLAKNGHKVDIFQRESTVGGLIATFDFDGLHDAALTALSTNYRIGKAEVNALGLFDDSSATAILSALVDWPTVLKWKEKKTVGVI